MISQIVMIIALISIWLSLAWGLVILFSAVHFWFKHSDFRVNTDPLPYYPKVTIVVPAHNEDVVIAQTAKAILDMNYPHDRVELLLFADNCSDRTYEECLAVKALPEYAGRDLTIINRSGTGGKAGVLNDALAMATGDYICVYDADAMPEKNALYFLVKEVLKDPERHVASFGRNKTRNANQNFLPAVSTKRLLSPNGSTMWACGISLRLDEFQELTSLFKPNLSRVSEDGKTVP